MSTPVSSLNICLRDFLERMSHEGLIPNIDITKEGFRMDKKSPEKLGIKCYIGFGENKSVDYLYKEEASVESYFIEFSDLWASYQQIMTLILSIKNSNLDRQNKRALVKEKYSAISRELIEKYKDSIYILNYVKMNLQCDCVICRSICNSNTHNYKIIISEYDSDQKVRSEQIRIFNDIKNNVITGLSKKICKNVKLMPIDIWK